MNNDDFFDRLRAAAVPREKVETEALGTVYLRPRTGEDRWRFLKLQEQLTKEGVRTIPPAMVVAVALVHEDGRPCVTDNFDEAMELLGRIPEETLMKLYDRAIELMGLATHALEDAEKKTLETPNSETGTSLPSSSEAAP